ncbi:sunset domain-containing protein [Enemella sp. A6]|uniref:sunset domain-containing protein n=1 Tax=Enemella sp. A6 TaxID=3440152 RepID=UPI003EBF3586
MKRKKQHVELAERGSAALDKAVSTVTPYVEQAQAYASEALAPALGKAEVGLDAAKTTVQDTLLPKLNEMVHDAAEAPNTKEAVKRSRTAAAALRGDIEVSERDLNKIAKRRAKKAEKRNKAIAKEFKDAKKNISDEVEAVKKRALKKQKKNKKGKFGKVLLVLTIIGAVGVVVKQLLAAKRDDPWQSYEPSTFSGPTSTTPTEPASPVTTITEPAGPAAEATMDDTLAAAVAADAPEVAEAAVAETEVQPVDPVAEVAPEASKFGEGSYVGMEPPAGYDIKGNDRSMKYHVAGSDSYDRTIADVWFNSTEAAEAAGFTRAQR